MIIIPSVLKSSLIDLDKNLHELGKNLYGRKLFKEYSEGSQFCHFYMEVNGDGAFTLHFVDGILGHIDKKEFSTKEEEVLQEIELLSALVKNKLKLVSA